MVAEPTVVVVDDDDAVRDSLQAMLEAEGFAVETFAAAADFLEGYRPTSNSCLVIDVRMPGMDGIELLTKLATRVSSPPVIMMTGHGDVPMAVMAMKLGAVDFVEKPFAAATLVRSIRDALAACRPASTATYEIDGRLARLTGRERDVLEQLVVGRSNKEIALELGISPRTVEIHRARVMEKMQAQSLSHLVRMALAAGIDPGEA
jgi:two-component system, LuxR family, response regulator FixJ